MVERNSLVLLVEDDRELREGLTAVCTTAGCKVVSATRADEAVDHLQRTPFDAVVVELALPTDGLALCARIRELDPSVPIILTSAIYTHVEPDLQAPVFDAFIPRPFGHFEIIETLEKIIEGRHTTEPPLGSISQLPMRGTLERTPFEALLYKLFDTRLTGRLHLTRGNAEHALYFLRGFPAWATSTTRTEALGTLLVRKGLLDAATLNEFLRRPSHRGASLGQRLVAAGVISNTQLLRTLEEQVRERVLTWFSMSDGKWAVDSGDEFVYRYDVYVQNPIELIFQGVAASEETNALAARLKERADHVLVPTRNFERLLPLIELDEVQRELLAHIDGSRRLGQLIQHWHGSFPDFFRFVWSLHATRIVYASPKAVRLHEQTSLDRILAVAPHGEVFRRVEHVRRDVSGMGQGVSRPGSAVTAPERVPAALHVTDVLDELLELHDFLEHLNHFDLFGLTLDAEQDEIRIAIQQRVAGLDPEVIKNLPPDDVRRIATVGRRIKAAAAILMDPNRRAVYRDEVVAALEAEQQQLGGGPDELARGRQLLEDGAWDEARAVFESLIERNRVDAHATALLARVMHLSNPGDRRVLNSAKALLYRALAFDDRLAEAHYFLAAIELKLSNHGAAMESVERALELDPDYAPAIDLKALLSGDTGGTMPIVPGLFTKG